MAQSRPHNRTTLYAAFTSGGEPVQDAFDFNRSKLETLLADRVANGTGFPGERIQRCTVAFYRRQLVENGFPIPRGLDAPVAPPAPAALPISLSREDISHLLHALDVSIADIESRASESPVLAELSLSVNRGLRGRLAALLVRDELQG